MQKRVESGGGFEKQPLIDEQLASKVRQNSIIRRFQGEISQQDAGRILELSIRCFGLSGLKASADALTRSIQLDAREGQRTNVIEYCGEAIDMPLRGVNLSSGTWLGYNEFKRSGLFSRQAIEAAMNNEWGRGDIWPNLVKMGFPGSYADASGLKNDPQDGVAGFMQYVSVDPRFRGFQLSEHIIRGTLGCLREEGLDYAVAYARAPRYLNDGGRSVGGLPTIDEYVRGTDRTGLHPDWGIRFHQKAGGKVICGIPNCAEDDTESGGCGALIVYDLRRLSGR